MSRQLVTSEHVYNLPPNLVSFPVRQRSQLGSELNKVLATIFDLTSQAKQAHWNVRGVHFRSLHKLFDVLFNGVHPFVDRVAERVAQFDVVVTGSVRDVVASTFLKPYPVNIHLMTWHDHVVHLAENCLRAMRLISRVVQNASHNFRDEATTTLLGELLEEIDKYRWMLTTTVSQ